MRPCRSSPTRRSASRRSSASASHFHHLEPRFGDICTLRAAVPSVVLRCGAVRLQSVPRNLGPCAGPGPAASGPEPIELEFASPEGHRRRPAEPAATGVPTASPSLLLSHWPLLAIVLLSSLSNPLAFSRSDHALAVSASALALPPAANSAPDASSTPARFRGTPMPQAPWPQHLRPYKRESTPSRPI